MTVDVLYTKYTVKFVYNDKRNILMNTWKFKYQCEIFEFEKKIYIWFVQEEIEYIQNALIDFFKLMI